MPDGVQPATANLLNIQQYKESVLFNLQAGMAFEDDDDGSEKELQKAGSIVVSKTFPISGTSLASLESLSLPLVQEVVLSADMQCEKCQKRVADIITRMNAVTESIMVNVLEKKVRITFKISTDGKVIPHQISNRTPLPKVAIIIKRIFRSSRG